MIQQTANYSQGPFKRAKTTTNSKNETLTLNNDTVASPISEMIRAKATATRFLEILDYINSTLANATMTVLTNMNDTIQNSTTTTQRLEAFQLDAVVGCLVP
ncbi:hypothetical protein BGX21_009721 [Mortierella sp. AD011]|nr:hypothetical protein BGX21_009721 [Mortierella sp. AD011]